ncbi:hypothetical protein FA15DRAFT_705085 [Coprinopsis marcescibilis]|uniref:Uncharacterized protein n=1 Tax=Coprinopsis marcescibilis TaxID=230819 RepID=A0A5C3KTW7_COPMA|nr:hypothetical protein FA15DRAFT_705085 [Coprinopsis marcescibilis]
MHSKGIFVALFLAFAPFSFAVPTFVKRSSNVPTPSYPNNAARMAAGLGPLAPAGLRRRTNGGGNNRQQPGGGKDQGKHNGGKHKNPTTLPKPSPVPVPDDKGKGRLKCNKKGGGFVGYVSGDFSSKDKNKRGFGLCNTKPKALEVDFDTSVTPFNIKFHNTREFPTLGWSGNNLNSGNSAVLTGTRNTNINNAPSNVGNAFSGFSANSESQVWHYTKNSKRFEAKWVNTGGIKVETKVCYNPKDDMFHLVTDVNAFKRRNPSAYEVEFELDED